MNESEILTLVRREIAKQLNIVLTGKTANATSDCAQEDIGEMYPGMPTIQTRPVMHPYGFASRAPDNTISVVAMQGAQKQNRVVLGHRAGDRPKLDNAGDVVLYDATGKHTVKLSKNGGVEISTGDKVTFSDGIGTFTMTNGTFKFQGASAELMAQIVALLQDLLSAMVMTALGPQPFLPVTITALTQVLTQVETIAG